MALLRFCLTLAVLAQLCAANSAHPVYLRVTVTMSDPAGDQLVPSLEQEDFQVLNDGVPQPISYFSAQPLPSSVAILLDVDGSMQNLDLDDSLENLIQFCNTRYVPDEISLIAFSQKPTVVKGFESTADKISLDTILPRLKSKNRYGRTGIEEAFVVAEETLRTRSSNYNRAVILITDAEEDLSRDEALKLEERLEKMGLRVYGIFFPGENRLDLGRLHQLSAATGGRYFRVSDTEILNLLVRWALHELRYHYVLGFSTPTDPLQLDEQSIDVRLTNPEEVPDPRVRFNIVQTIGRVRQNSENLSSSLP